MTRDTMTPHLDGAELVRLMDGEGAPGERARWAGHIDHCSACRAEADSLRIESETVSRWLAAAEFEAGPAPVAARPDRPAARATRTPRATPLAPTHGRVWLKAAIIVLLVAAPVAAIPAVRDWVADRVGLATDPPAPPAAEAARTPAPGLAATIRFVPDPGPFRVVVDATQAAGTLTLGRSTGAEAILELGDDAGTVEPVVSARGVQIGNTGAGVGVGVGVDAGAGEGSYVLRLPARVTDVTVTVAGRELRVGAGELERGVVVRLDGAPTPR